MSAEITALLGKIDTLAEEDLSLVAAKIVETNQQEIAITEIVKRLQIEIAPLTRLKAIQSLSLLKSPVATPHLASLLQNTDEVTVIRRLALGALEQLNDPLGSASVFEVILPDKELGEAATKALGAAISLLVQIWQDEKLPTVERQKAWDQIRQIRVASLGRVLRRSETNSPHGPAPAIAAATVLGERGHPAVEVLCKYLSDDLAEQITHVVDPPPDIEFNSNVVVAVINALYKVGTDEVVPCLGGVLGKHLNVAVRERAANRLGRLEHTKAIKYLAQALLMDKDAKVKEQTSQALTRFSDWKDKTAHIVRVLQSEELQRSQIDQDVVMRALQPSDEPQELLTDHLIDLAIANNDDRVLAILASLIINSANNSRNTAANRLEVYKQTYPKVTEKILRPLRLEIGGARALSPLLVQLEENLEKDFRQPLRDLNSETRNQWKWTIRIAYWGFGIRAFLSIILFFVGVWLAIISYLDLRAGQLGLADLVGPGLSFIGGLATMSATVFFGPLKEIRQAVGDVGVANAAFIAFMYRVSQISHTFAYYYLEERMTFGELTEASRLVGLALQETMTAMRLDNSNSSTLTNARAEVTENESRSVTTDFGGL